MRVLSPVVWTEGMHLAQHHFQAQSRYFEDSTAFALSSLFFEPYGLVGCELDSAALLNGTVSLIHARGVMPDGLAFHFPDDPLPDPLEIRDLFSPTHDHHVVLLAIPAFVPGGANCALPPQVNGRGMRYSVYSATLADQITGQDTRAVDLARKNLRLMLDVEATDDLVTLPIARIRRDGSGQYIYDPSFIPPCIRIGASPRLLDLLRRLIEMLDAKADTLARRRQGGGGPAGYAADEIAGFWLAHTIHSSLGLLRHQLELRSVHPEQTFLELSRLAGALCTFSMDAHPRTLPLYDHDRLDACLEALDVHIRANLDVVLPTRALPTALVARGQSIYAAAVTDRRSFGRAHWFLGVRSSLPRAQLAGTVPGLVKVCSEKFVPELVRRGMDGLTLEHLPSPPAALAPRMGSEYFRITTDGPCWNSIVDTATIGVYAPGALKDVELELVVVAED